MHACMHACFGEHDKDSIKALNLPDVLTMKITIFRTMLMLILVVEALQNLLELSSFQRFVVNVLIVGIVNPSAHAGRSEKCEALKLQHVVEQLKALKEFVL